MTLRANSQRAAIPGIRTTLRQPVNVLQLLVAWAGCRERVIVVVAYASGQPSRWPLLTFCMGEIMDLFDLSGKTAVVTGGSRGIGLMIARGLLEAGATWGAPIEEFPATAWDKVVDLNLKAPFLLTQAFLPLLEAGGTHEDPARVINIGSIDGLRVPPFPTYAGQQGWAAPPDPGAADPRRITVNAVAPGPFESKMMAATLTFGHDRRRSSAEADRPPRRHGRRRDLPASPAYSPRYPR